MNKHIVDSIEHAAQRALATYGPNGVNVVPISMAHVHGEEVWLFNFFMDKTLENILTTPEVALSCWTDFTGVQIKAHASYHSMDDIHALAINWVAAQNPQRVVRGVFVLKPVECFDISAGERAGEPLSLQ